MKKMIMTAMVVLAGLTANAAQMGNCLNAIQNKCGSLNALRAIINLDRLDSTQECKWVQQGASTITFMDQNDIISTDLNRCQTNAARTVGRINDSAVFGGRLFLTTNFNKVVMVGKNACIFELLNSSGQSYSAVRGLSVRDGELVLEGTSAKLSEDQIQKRIDSNKLRMIECR